MTAHTPGPLTLEREQVEPGRARYYLWADLDSADPTIVARVFFLDYGPLLAAAPELLEACLAVHASGGLRGANLSNALIQVKAAIAKARGEQP